MLVLARDEVRALLDPDELVEALARAHEDLSAGRASMPPRIAARVAERGGLLAAMPAYLPSADALAVKLVTVFPHNRAPRPSHQAAILVFDAEYGHPLALLDGTEITAARTAAASALAARLLARADATVLAVLGTGVQARAHVAALRRVRPFAVIRIAGRDPAKAESLAGEVGATAVASYEQAVRGADVVAAATHSPEPVVRREWLAPGTHVSSVGLNAEGPEVDAATVADALVVVESRDAALAPFPAGAQELAEAGEAAIHAELGEIVAGKAPGRTSDDQLTLYKSVGVAVQDAAAAALVLARARERNAGREIELEESEP